MSTTWSRLLGATWVLAAIAHGFVSVASRRTGKPLWWVDNNGFAGSMTPVVGAGLVYLVMLVAFVVAVRRAPPAPFVSAAASLVLAACAIVDLSAAPGSAVVALAICAAAMLASLAALAGRAAH
ncbi:MAG: hypothetical protein FGM42_06890 [Ilumatobacteraceae bacterium]|nr:hypothetical protein [Ilumatobacteraceae bacterium]